MRTDHLGYAGPRRRPIGAAAIAAAAFWALGGPAPCLAQTPGAPPITITPGAPPASRIPPLIVPSYIIAVLDSVTVHNDKDDTGPGEIVIAAGGGTGQPGLTPTVQTTRFPIRLWREANSGNVIPVNLPLFALPESQMRDSLFLAAAVIDNDEIPSWLGTAVPLMGTAVGTYIGTELGSPGIGAKTGGLLGGALVSYLKKNEAIGGLERLHSRGFDNWGLPAPGAEIPDPCRFYSVRAAEMTAAYRVCRISQLAANYRVYVRLDRLRIHENGDGAGGEIYAWMRVSDAITTSAAIERRFPSRATSDRNDGSTWSLGELVYNGASTRVPFVRVEVDVWDEDAADAGDDDDMLGVASWMVFLPNLTLPARVGERREYPQTLRARGIDEGDVTVEWTLIVERV
jgi:hypothetical protein